MEFAPGDSAELVAWSDGRFGIVRKGREVGQEQWGRGKIAECGQAFLNYVRKNKIPVTIFLVNGVKLQGVVTWFDNFCVLLRRDGHSQLVYKHAISTIMPGHPIQLFEGAEEAPAEKA